jgi:hypothetical protein
LRDYDVRLAFRRRLDAHADGPYAQADVTDDDEDVLDAELDGLDEEAD